MVNSLSAAQFSVMVLAEGGSAGAVDWPLMALVVGGLAFQLLHRRLPAGLGTSIFVGAVSLASGLWAFDRGSSTWSLYFAAHITSTLCVLWAGLGWFASLFRREARAAGVSSADTFFAWSLVTGVAAAVLVFNALVALTLSRVLNPSSMFVQMPGGTEWWDLLALFVAVLFRIAAGPRPEQPVMVLILAAMFVWWTGLMVPSVRGGDPVTGWEWVDHRPGWWNWEFQLQAGFTLVLMCAAVFQELRYRARCRAAWPDRLDDLIAPYARWPLFIQVEAIIAGAILILGVYQIVQREPMTWPLALTGCAISIMAGYTCFFMTYRRWSGNTASLGIALLTLAAAMAACFVAAVLGLVAQGEGYADRLPVLFNAILFGLAVMIALWRWLAGVWDQQLLDGVPWTTTGRLIPYAKRGAFVIASLAMLAAFQIALWPEMVTSSGDDNSRGRMIAGVLAIAWLVLITTRIARRENSSQAATLGVALLCALAIFVFLRMPASPLRGWLIQYRAVVLAFLAMPILVAAEALLKTSWKFVAPPLWMLALLLLPAVAMLKLLSPTALPSEWVKPLTLAMLGALYSFAGSREHRRALLVLGAVLLVAAASSLYNAYGSSVFGGRPAAMHESESAGSYVACAPSYSE